MTTCVRPVTNPYKIPTMPTAQPVKPITNPPLGNKRAATHASHCLSMVREGLLMNR
jgi:hypothetical protein